MSVDSRHDLERAIAIRSEGSDLDNECNEINQPRASAHIEWDEPTNSTAKRTYADLGNHGGRPATLRPYGRGGVHVTLIGPNPPTHPSESSELARAEAASWAQMTPLMAATLGPLSVILGIPTLSQRWHGMLLDPSVLPTGASNFVELPDQVLSLYLAGISLFCEVAGNGFLILRFSNFHTKTTTWLSYGFWIAKIVVCVANYIQFGLSYPQSDVIVYLEGFWVIPFLFLFRLAYAGWRSRSSSSFF